MCCLDLHPCHTFFGTYLRIVGAGWLTLPVYCLQVLKLIIAVALLGVVGLDAAALIAGPKQYFTYYRNKDTGFQFK